MANSVNHPPRRKRKGTQKNNSSGITGVMFITRNYGMGPIPYIIVAYVDEYGVDHRYSRSVEANGLETAMKWALKMRRRMGAANIPTLHDAMCMFSDWYHAVRLYG